MLLSLKIKYEIFLLKLFYSYFQIPTNTKNNKILFHFKLFKFIVIILYPYNTVEGISSQKIKNNILFLSFFNIYLTSRKCFLKFSRIL